MKNLSVEVLPQFELIRLNELKVGVFGGLNVGFNISLDNPDIFFNGRHPGVVLVFNSLDDIAKPVSLSFISGFSVEYKRFIFWVRRQHESNYAEKIEISGKNYPFKSSWRFRTYSIGYRLYKLPRFRKKGI